MINFNDAGPREGDGLVTRRMSGFNKAPRIVTAAAVGISMTGVLSACSLGNEDVYCVDKDNVVVDEALCDESNSSGGGGGGFFFLIGAFGGGYGPGTRLDGSRGQRISSTDRAGRERAGLPGSGRVSNGSKSTGGFGKSGSGDSGSKGGWGGGSKSGG